MKYNLILNDITPEIMVDSNRVIQYAEHRLEANPEERACWSFDTLNMNIQQAILVINSFEEDVEIINERTAVETVYFIIFSTCNEIFTNAGYIEEKASRAANRLAIRNTWIFFNDPSINSLKELEIRSSKLPHIFS